MSVVAICQSNYIPWKGYFDLIAGADYFVIYDHVQYTKNDWRNRNLIKTSDGPQWLTINVKHHSLHQSIRNTVIDWPGWNRKHWKTIETNYIRAPFYNQFNKDFKDLYLSCAETLLSNINRLFLHAILDFMSIKTIVLDSFDFPLIEDRNLNLINICKTLACDTYLSGPSGKNYLNTDLFNEHEIQIRWMDYQGYKEYPQLFGPFIHQVSILDLIFNTGEEARSFLKY